LSDEYPNSQSGRGSFNSVLSEYYNRIYPRGTIEEAQSIWSAKSTMWAAEAEAKQKAELLRAISPSETLKNQMSQINETLTSATAGLSMAVKSWQDEQRKSVEALRPQMTRPHVARSDTLSVEKIPELRDDDGKAQERHGEITALLKITAEGIDALKEHTIATTQENAKFQDEQAEAGSRRHVEQLVVGRENIYLAKITAVLSVITALLMVYQIFFQKPPEVKSTIDPKQVEELISAMKEQSNNKSKLPISKQK
jgi:hypothetical protein